MFIPEGVTESTLKVLRDEDAEVVVIGKFYAEALKAAVEMTKENPRALLVEAYNDPLLWEGHGSMIKEIQTQIPKKPSAIFCSVGGAGMLGGVLEGCRAVGWEDGMPLSHFLDLTDHRFGVQSPSSLSKPSGQTASTTQCRSTTGDSTQRNERCQKTQTWFAMRKRVCVLPTSESSTRRLLDRWERLSRPRPL